MTARFTRRWDRAFRWALRAYPAAFRARFADGMREAFVERVEARRRTRGPVAASWTAALGLINTAWHGMAERRLDRTRRRWTRSHRERPQMTALASDLRHTWRRLRARPAPSLLAAGMLALAIGLTAAMFTVIDALLLRPVPFPHAAQLARIVMFGPRGGSTLVSPAVLEAWRRSAAFEAVEGVAEATSIVDTERGPMTTQTAFVSPGLFQMLGATPTRGRLFDDSEAGPRGRDLVILSQWWAQSAFGGRADLVGSRIAVDGESLLVIGILPQSFRFPESTTSLWRPVDFSAPPPDLSVGNPAAYARFFQERPRETVLAMATDRARAVDARLASQPDVRAQEMPIAGASAREYLARIAPYLAGGVVLVFVVLCANVASLLLAQMTARRVEFRTCTALGASRRRLFRQALTESATLGGLGMAGGVLLAWALVALARAFLPESFLLQSLNPLDVDVRALGAACAAGFCATASAGLVPAWAGTRAESTSSLAPGDRAGTETPLARRTTRTLLVVEIALGCTLLVGAGLLVRSFINLSHVDRGLDTRNVITAWVQLALPQGAAEADRRAAADRLAAELGALPGVQALTLSRGLPPDGSEIYFGDDWQSDVAGAPALSLQAHGYPVTQEFFDFYGIRMLAGRSFAPADDRYKVIVSEEFAARLWPGENPVGRTYRHGNSQPNEVIGLVSEIRHPSLDPLDDLPEVYYRYAGGGSSVMVSLRCSADCLDLPRLRRWLLEGPASSVIRLGVLDDAYRESLARPRAAAALSLTFAGIAMAAASSGLFSVLTYAVSRRRREFGIRASLGARPVDLQIEVVREGVRLAAIGALIGGSGAWLSTRWLQSLVYDVSRVDPATIAIVLGIVAATTLVAVWAPSRRASRANPVELLREL